MITDRKKDAITRILVKNVEEPYTVIIDNQGVKVFKNTYMIQYVNWPTIDNPVIFRNIFRLITNWYNRSRCNSFDDYD